MEYTNLQSSFHSYVLLSARLLLHCRRVCFLSSQSLFVPLLPSHLLFTSNNLFSPVDEEYSVHTIPHEFQYPRIRISSILLCASIGVDCRVESSISPGARLHDMIIIANQVQSTEIFHPPILIPVVCLYCCVCCYDLNIHIHKYALSLSCYTSNVSSMYIVGSGLPPSSYQSWLCYVCTKPNYIPHLHRYWQYHWRTPTD